MQNLHVLTILDFIESFYKVVLVLTLFKDFSSMQRDLQKNNGLKPDEIKQNLSYFQNKS